MDLQAQAPKIFGSNNNVHIQTLITSLQEMVWNIVYMGKGRGGGRNGKNNGHVRSGKNYNGGGSYTPKPKPPKPKKGNS